MRLAKRVRIAGRAMLQYSLKTKERLNIDSLKKTNEILAIFTFRFTKKTAKT